MTTYSRSVETALTIVGSPTGGANVFNPVVVQGIGLGQRQGRATEQNLAETLTLSDLVNYQPLEELTEAVYFSGILSGSNAGQLFSQNISLEDSLSVEITAIRLIESDLIFNQYVSAFIVGLRETCVLTLAGSTKLETITEYTGQQTETLTLSQSVSVAGTYNPSVNQTLNLSEDIE